MTLSGWESLAQHWLPQSIRLSPVQYCFRPFILEGENNVWSRVIWDVTAIGWLLNDDRRLLLDSLVPTPVPEYDHHYTLDPSRLLFEKD